MTKRANTKSVETGFVMVSIELPTETISQLEIIAQKEGVEVEALVLKWIKERLDKEEGAFDLN